MTVIKKPSQVFYFSSLRRWLHISISSTSFQQSRASSKFRRLCPSCGCLNLIIDSECIYCDHVLDNKTVQEKPFDFTQQATLLHNEITSFSIPFQLKSSAQQSSAEDVHYQSIYKEPRKVEVLERNYDVTVATHPYPISSIHLVSIARASKRPSILRLSRSDIHCCSQLRFHGLSCLPALLPLQLKSMKASILKYIIMGFEYPSSYSQLHLHLIVPPIMNYKFFQSHRFITFKKVIRLLEDYGHIHPKMLEESNGRINYMTDILHCDSEVKRILDSKGTK